ncbi:MAG TPA: ATP-binding protein, partial [Ferruginibacter sp.]|nr:ATP-binding protein [Ferruginibacter sp.]
NLFRIIQEVVNNAIKYSVAKNIEINISQQEKLLKMSIADDGIGFDYDQVKTTSYGLTNIQNRVDEINGKLKVETAVNRGTRFNIE